MANATPNNTGASRSRAAMPDGCTESGIGPGRLLDEINRALLDRVQRGVPLVERPFAAVAAELAHDGITVEAGEYTGAQTGAAGGDRGELAVIARLGRLQRERLIRRLGPVMDSRALGYTGTLCGAVVAPAELESVAAAVAAYPGVTHSYEREDCFNLWFTVLAPGRKAVVRLVCEIRALAGVETLVELPMEQQYKINVQFRLGETWEAPRSPVECIGSPAAGAPAPPPPSTREKAIIRVVQDDLPLESRPFALLAERCTAAGIRLTETELIGELRRLCSLGYIRRIGAALSHRRIGIRANGMVVWQVPSERCDALGPKVAAFDEVTHCYRRRAETAWPYNLYAMVHAATREKCLEQVSRIDAAMGGYPHRVLFSVREFKKSSMRYFYEENTHA